MKHGQGHVQHNALETLPISAHYRNKLKHLRKTPILHNSLGGIEIPYMNPIPSARYDPTKLQHSPLDNCCSTGVICSGIICRDNFFGSCGLNTQVAQDSVLSPAYLFFFFFLGEIIYADLQQTEYFLSLSLPAIIIV